MEEKTRRPVNPVIKILRVLLAIVILILLAAAALFATLTIMEYKPADSEILPLEGHASDTLSTGSSFTIMTWNVGYGALGDNSDFFMDGGEMVMTADADRIYQNLYGILDAIRVESPDILFLQEVDQDATRSRHINEKAWFQEAFPESQSSYACNYNALFVPYPLPPLGKVDAGIMTFSRYPAVSAERIQLPVPFSWPVRTVNLKRCLDVERIPVENSDKELVLVNLHLEAYDSGEGKIAQTKMLIDLLREEAEKGNYVIAGGDFNQVFPNIDYSDYPLQEGRWHPGIIELNALEEIWQCIMDTSVPSCRSLDQPYAGADHENFQYYLIDGFIVSDTLTVEDYHTADLQFVNSDHNPLVMNIRIPDGSETAEGFLEDGPAPAGAGAPDTASGTADGAAQDGTDAGAAQTDADAASGAAAGTEAAVLTPVPTEAPDREYDFTLGFAGDICLADNYIPMQYLEAIGSKDISDGIDPRYIEIMKNMDLMWINNEFAYSTRGEPLYGKAFTFCADPANVSYLHDLGIDIVGAANNHTFDFGEDAFLDTLETLENASIPYVGAGRTAAEAFSPVYLETNGFTIAYVAASFIEYGIFTPAATDTTPGIVCCDNHEPVLEMIREASENADYVVVLPHWGIEHSTDLQDLQVSGAHAYIDAGADAVIGAHPHILQGIEYYNGKPILYSLGNFWFDNYDIDTMIAELHFTGTIPADEEASLDDASVELTVYPGTQTGTYTWLADTPDWKNGILRYLESISVNITIDEHDVVRETGYAEDAPAEGDTV